MTFLEFAKQDLLEPSDRGKVNALSNAKRAVENRVDTLLYAYGLRGHAESQRCGFPRKAEMLRLTGLFIPQAIHHMITVPRNELEHEYKIPRSYQEVSDIVDVAQLFLVNSGIEVNRGFYRWVVGPKDLSSQAVNGNLKVNSLPDGAYGLWIDRPKRTLGLVKDGQEQKLGFAELEAPDLAKIFRLLRSSIVPGFTQIVGPMTESAFAEAYL